MDKKKLLKRVFDVHVWAVAIAIIGIATAVAQVTITAYYPAPYGGYNIVKCDNSGTSLGRVEAPYYFSNPSGIGTPPGPQYWLNPAGGNITTYGPSTTNATEASRINILGINQIFDIGDTSRIVDPAGISKMLGLEVNNLKVIRPAGASVAALGDCTIDQDLTVGRDVTIGGNLIVTGEIRTPKIVGTSADHFGGQGVMLYNNLKVFNDLRVERNVGIGGTYYKGGSCHAFIDTKDGTRLLASIESPEYKFVDEGQAQLQNGIAKIKIDEIFKDAIETDNYLVFVTAVNDCKGLWVSEKTPDYFIVKEMQGGRSDARFSWQISAVRKGYKDIRFKPYEERITAKKSLGDD